MNKYYVKGTLVWYVRKNDKGEFYVSSGQIMSYDPLPNMYIIEDLFDGHTLKQRPWNVFSSKPEARHYLEELKSANRNLD